LGEPAPVDHEVDVTVHFPDDNTVAGPAPGFPPVPSEEEWQRRMSLLESVLDEWKADDSGYDEESWPELKRALEQNRLRSGDRREPFDE
jgi:hypothetical protein